MSKKKENRTEFKNASVGKVLLSGLVILAIVGGLWLLYSTTKEGATRVGPVAGKAVSGFGNTPLRIGALAEGRLAIDPVSGDAVLNEEFTVDVIINPADAPFAGMVSPPRFTNYKFNILFDQTVLTYVDARNLVPGAGWTFSSENNGAGQLTITAQSFTDFFGMTQDELVEITFRPKALSLDGTPITPLNFVNVNSYGADGSNVDIVSSYAAGTISIFSRWYPDVDLDGFGNSSDPGFVGVKPPRYVADHGDCSDNDIAVNPDAVEVCDGVDNNCDGSINDEVPPTCAGLGKACGIHRVCNNSAGVPTRFLDCNIGDGGVLLLGADKCGGGNICNDAGQCVDPNAGCDVCPPPVVCPTCALLTMPQPLTPGCGGDGVPVDADGDGNPCDYFETTTTCPTDCTACPAGVADCLAPDSDRDGLSDGYETYLDGLMASHGFGANLGFNLGSSDSDSDGVPDGSDFCPGTKVDIGPGLSVANGRINVNGCYTGDVGTASADRGRPDGCFSLKDTTFLIDYYVGRGGVPLCTSVLK